MKKSIAAMAMGLIMALALPAMAFAAPSPQGTILGPVAGENGSISVIIGDSAMAPGSDPYLIVEPAATPSTTAAIVPSTEQILDTYAVYMSDGSEIRGPVTLSFNVGSQYAGKTARVYVVHGQDPSGAAALDKTANVAADGTVSHTITALSYYTVTIEPESAGPAGDSGSTSPQTGANPLTVVAAIACALAVSGAVVASRKKIAE